MTVSLAELATSPDHYLYALDGDEAVFVTMDRAAYHRSIFLDGRISPASEGLLRLPLSSLAGKAEATQWIFHVAHCGSTLLARALDRPDANLVLREPAALRQLGIAPDAGRLATVLAMLGRRYCPDRPTIVKANVPVNFILPAIVATDPDARAIFLYCGLRDYLLSVLRSEGHRKWVRQITDHFAPALGDVSILSDAGRAAALWRGQMRAFAAVMPQMPNARSLNAEAFFARPADVLTAAAALFDVTMSDAAVAQTVNGPLFSHSAKNPALTFDNAQRMARRVALDKMLAPELDQAEQWVERAGGKIILDRPLV